MPASRKKERHAAPDHPSPADASFSPPRRDNRRFATQKPTSAAPRADPVPSPDWEFRLRTVTDSPRNRGRVAKLAVSVMLRVFTSTKEARAGHMRSMRATGVGARR